MSRPSGLFSAGRLMLAAAALACCATPDAWAQTRRKPPAQTQIVAPPAPKPVARPSAASPAAGAAATAAGAGAAADPTLDLPVDSDPAPRLGGLAPEASGGGDCRTACASTYYACLPQDSAMDCPAAWSQCVAACPSVTSSDIEPR